MRTCGDGHDGPVLPTDLDAPQSLSATLRPQSAGSSADNVSRRVRRAGPACAAQP
jgi:hypothetical protein